MLKTNFVISNMPETRPNTPFPGGGLCFELPVMFGCSVFVELYANQNTAKTEVAFFANKDRVSMGSLYLRKWTGKIQHLS